MKVISKFKDVYDGALNLGVDDGLKWVRSPQAYNVSYGWLPKLGRSGQTFTPPASPALEKLYRRFPWYTTSSRTDFTLLLVIAGRRWWRGVEVQVPSGVLPDLRPVKVTLWNEETVRNTVICDCHGNTRFLENVPVHVREQMLGRYDTSWSGELSDAEVQHTYEVGSPLYLMRSSYDENLIVNPCLRLYNAVGFSHVTEIAQEIQMWLGNQASKDDTPIKIGDKDRIQQHGFDHWSFRKPGSAGMY